MPASGYEASRVIATSVLIVAIIAACNREGPDPGLLEPNRADVSKNILEFDTRGPEGPNILIGQHVPSFGGAWFDSLGNMHVYTLAIEDSARLKTELMPRYERYDLRDDRPVNRKRAIVFEKAKYAYIDLLLWRRQIARTALSEELSGFQGSGVRDYQNQIHIMVSSFVASQEIARIAEAQAIPAGAYEVQIVGPIQDLDTLWDSISIRKGGRGISLSWDAYTVAHPKECTLGFNILAGTQFVTASHCTERYGPDVSTAGAYNQGLRYIGSESSDPPFWGNSVDPCCDSSQPKCRYSDAAIFDYDLGEKAGLSGQGYIHRTDSAATGSANSGSRTVIGNIEITDEYPVESLDRVDKMGQVSGWTYGNVTDVCYHAPHNGKEFMCQMVIFGMRAVEGDSGSPVFRYNTGTGTAKLAGILWGGVAPYYTYASKIQWMKDVNDLGYMGVTH